MNLQTLKERLQYDRDTGVWTWLKPASNRVQVGSQAGTINTNGYRQISIDGKLYRSARLAIFYCTGEWPKVADHINRVRDDDRAINLRAVDATGNSHNLSIMGSNTSGHTGVSWCRQSSQWAAQICARGRKYHLGRFAEKQAAADAYSTAKAQLHHYKEPTT